MPVAAEEIEEPEEAEEAEVAAAAPFEEEEEEEAAEAAEPQSEWVFPPAALIPLKYQKNKFYYQYRIDELPEGMQVPQIIIGYCRADFDPETDFILQEDVWCMSL